MKIIVAVKEEYINSCSGCNFNQTPDCQKIYFCTGIIWKTLGDYVRSGFGKIIKVKVI